MPTTLTPEISVASFKDINVDRGVLGVDRAGNIWFGGLAGLFRFDGTVRSWLQAGGEVAFIREGEIERLPT